MEHEVLTASVTTKFPDGVVAVLQRPIDKKALSSAPRGLTSIKSIYITERLNEAFGFGRWYVHDNLVEVAHPMVVVKAHLELVDYPWFRAASYGGNNNPDLGDAYKGAVSDAISKIGAMYLGIAVEVYKGLSGEAPKPDVTPKTQPTPKAQPAKLDSPQFKYEGTRLTCSPQKVDDHTSKKGAPYLGVRLNGKAGEKDVAFCFRAHLFEAVRASLKKPSQFEVEMTNSGNLSIQDVLGVNGKEYRDGKMFSGKGAVDGLEITDEDIPF